MKKYILTIFALLFSFPLLAHPVLLFDTNVLIEEREGQRVMSYSKSTEMRDIRKRRVLSLEAYGAAQAALKLDLDRAYHRSHNSPHDRAIYNQKATEFEGKEKALFERYYAEKTILSIQEKNVFKKIKIIIDAIAKRLGISEVISYDSDSKTTMSPYLTFAGRHTVDITEEVLETINKEYIQRQG